MTDVNFKKLTDDVISPDGTTVDQGAPGVEETLPYDLIELLFFAYRDFTADPDDQLAEFGFGRAHHRVLHFVDRNPGIMVTDLLSILRITKQSLGRVLKQLVDQDFIEQRAGPIDRRQRLLHTTTKGHDLAIRLAALQAQRLERAINGLPDSGADTIRQFLFQMIDEDMRADVAKLVNKKYKPGAPQPSVPPVR
ncbi:MarR family transcriptional regulator [Roseibium polysiphoniae]|uniref:MarR family transcriptional regulator n=1 Tax=Roseibium polysiphoniae TaxID=2571221 RepID=A0A944CCK3_9HYPH|nr:MarR family winged helix-turn-helix transcriptional regulator [Roseibium polysiphoniae]MBS8260519.1 MarR family transcriptional regulator [Roseibium polysiphoniae]